MKENVIVRVEVKRDLWALVKAKATREAKRIPQVVEDILKEYFGVEGQD